MITFIANMKFLSALILLTILSIKPGTSPGQTILIETSEISFENKTRPSLSATIDPSTKIVLNAWKKYLQKNFAIKLSVLGMLSNNNLYKAMDVTIPQVSSKRMNIYTRILESGSGSEIKIFASFGYDFFVGAAEFPQEFEALQKIFNNFLMEHLNQYYTGETNTAANEIKSLTSEKVGLLKVIDKNEKQIFKLTDDINILNAIQKPTSKDEIKASKKILKLSDKRTRLENEANNSKISIKLIEEKIVQMDEKMEKLKLKHKEIVE